MYCKNEMAILTAILNFKHCKKKNLKDMISCETVLKNFIKKMNSKPCELCLHQLLAKVMHKIECFRSDTGIFTSYLYFYVYIF